MIVIRLKTMISRECKHNLLKCCFGGIQWNRSGSVNHNYRYYGSSFAGSVSHFPLPHNQLYRYT